ncbi:MAG: hypothetical protein HWN68_08335 [Desulfobacterales bacterium]|nr:hypothetical protein [Desulfobacterales bacterium]
MEKEGERTKTVEKALAIAIPVTVVLVFVASRVLTYTPSPTPPTFTIISDNGNSGVSFDENFEVVWNFTVYVKIKNVGVDGSKAVYCEVTRFDLTVSKQCKNVFLKANQQKIVVFFYSAIDLRNDYPKEYSVWVGS